jgi:hypothetical protein
MKNRKRDSGGEEWARRIVQQVLGRAVEKHDDGRLPGMYDLRIGSVDAPMVAIECVRAMDATYTETWMVGPAKGPYALPVRGDWIVEIAATAHVKDVIQNLTRILTELEGRGIHNLTADHWLKSGDEDLFNDIGSFGINHASCFRLEGSGKVHLTMPGDGGAVDNSGREVPKWLGDFLRAPAQSDVLSKLSRSKAPKRHAFVFVTLGGAPWSVASYFFNDPDQTPQDIPNLPEPVTAAWVAPQFGSTGLYWDGLTWRLVDILGLGIEGPPPN